MNIEPGSINYYKTAEDLANINKEIQESMSIDIEETLNIELWDRHFKTNPAATKRINKGYGTITTIDAYHQIKEATEEFGPMGKWGLMDVQLTMVGEIMWLNAMFFHPGGSFSTINSINMYIGKGDKKRLDDEAGKKLATDTITKCLSYLGFNADVFFHKFDDARYVEERTKEVADELLDKVLYSLDAAFNSKLIDEDQKSKLATRINDLHKAGDLDGLNRALEHTEGIGK